jgi:membrane-associated phospholipid phosphatase
MGIFILSDYIGLYAPIILFILTLFLLRNMQKYLYFFVSGTILNNILNIILKLSIKEPRPTDDQKTIEIGIVNGSRVNFDKFGMPSGHAQNCGFFLAFVTLVLNNPFITTLYLLISTISLLQRYLYKNHTVLQLLVGLSIGVGFGYLTYYLGNIYIMGNVKTRRDEYGPF